MDREQWQPFLERWSEEWIAAHDPDNDRPLDDSVVRDGWLGFAPASAEEIAAAQARLGCSLPPSLRSFLEVTNGWRDTGHFIGRLAGTAELGWLRDVDPLWIDSYGASFDEGAEEDCSVTPLLQRALQVSVEGDSAVMFLDPADVDANDEWAGYRLSSWSGQGPQRFDSFYDLMQRQYASFHGLRRPQG
jgi:hypothetical protein